MKSPISLEKDEIEEALEEKKPWILEKINRIEEESWPPKNKEFLSGEKILYRGRRYYTQVKQGDETNIKFGDDKFLIKSENYSENKEQF
ncbi:hypothetical protein HRED_08031 [Candidatus Haloredivivus sp. G17]|nr:hypothetical protein HRED_08031 [Candidatus Haloredivivus sp. G17]